MNTALSTESVGALESAYYALLAERDALRGQLLEERRTAAAELRDLDGYWIDKMSSAQKVIYNFVKFADYHDLRKIFPRIETQLCEMHGVLVQVRK